MRESDRDPTATGSVIAARHGRYLSTERKILVGFALALALLASIGAISYLSLASLTANAAAVTHSYEVTNSLDRFLLAVTETETAHRGYLLSGESSYLESYATSRAIANATLRNAEALTVDNPEQEARLATLRRLLSNRLTVSDERIELRRQQGLAAVLNVPTRGQGRQLQQQLRETVAQAKQAETNLLSERNVRAQRSTVLTKSVIIGGGVLAFCLVIVSLLLIRRDLAASRAVQKQLRRQEEALRRARDDLEVRVNARTAELAQANESLQLSERRFRAMIEHSGDVISLTDAEKVLYVSPSVLAVEGYRPEEILGKPGLREVHPDDLPMLADLQRQLDERPGQPVHMMWRRKHRQGHWMWIEGVATNLIADPAVRAVVANYRNVTERKKAEVRMQAQLARLALLSEITRAIGERQDSQSIFQVVVRSLEEQLPVDFACLCVYRPESDALVVANIGVNQRHLGLTEQSLVAIEANSLSRCMDGELIYEPDLSKVVTPFAQQSSNGGLRALVAAPLLTENEVFGVLIVARTAVDSFSSGECEFMRQLSEHVALAAHQSQLYQSLQSAYQELRQTQQAVMQQERLRVLGQMASGIAHDINNAISPVALYTETLLERETQLSEQGRGFLETIRRSIDDVAETVGRMREFYRQREQQVPMSPLQLNALVPQVIELTRARWSDMTQLRGHVIELRTELAAGLPPMLGIESELREALTNLILNAVDAMPQGGTLTVRTTIGSDGAAETENDSRPRVLMEVIDTGIGMDEETRRRCLELFFTTKGERGTGLGLAMVYGIVQRHNGEIDINSAPGKGTRVALKFPVSRAIVPVQSTVVAPLPRGLRVLVVDDDPIILESMQVVLDNDGCIVVPAEGGQQGIDAFDAALAGGLPFDLVITDLGMPAIDGRAVAAAVKAKSTVPVVMLTGWGQRMVNDGETPPHVDKVMSKPPKPRELRATIAELITRPTHV
jgi:PAS domain S-box-containing protein